MHACCQTCACAGGLQGVLIRCAHNTRLLMIPDCLSVLLRVRATWGAELPCACGHTEQEGACALDLCNTGFAARRIL